MKKAFQDVMDFHRKFAPHLIGSGPTCPSSGIKELRLKLIKEEYEELVRAIEEGNLVEIADGSADLVYVIAGANVSYGIDLPAVWDEVQRSNMTKSLSDRREDGKILKGPDFSPANIKKILIMQKRIETIYHE